MFHWCSRRAIATTSIACGRRSRAPASITSSARTPAASEPARPSTRNASNDIGDDFPKLPQRGGRSNKPLTPGLAFGYHERMDRYGPWTRRSVTESYDNPWIRVEHHDVLTPGGSEGIYGVVRFKNLAIGIIPLD